MIHRKLSKVRDCKIGTYEHFNGDEMTSLLKIIIESYVRPKPQSHLQLDWGKYLKLFRDWLRDMKSLVLISMLVLRFWHVLTYFSFFLSIHLISRTSLGEVVCHTLSRVVNVENDVSRHVVNSESMSS